MSYTEKATENFKKLQVIASCDMKSLSSLTHLIEERQIIAKNLLHGCKDQETHNKLMDYIEYLNEQIKNVIGL